MNLVSVIKEINRKLQQSECQRNDEIKAIHRKYDGAKVQLENALKVNMELNTVCLGCEGSKVVDIGSYDRVLDTCDWCNGTGIKAEETIESPTPSDGFHGRNLYDR